jgi:hypothetical protein
MLLVMLNPYIRLGILLKVRQPSDATDVRDRAVDITRVEQHAVVVGQHGIRTKHAVVQLVVLNLVAANRPLANLRDRARVDSSADVRILQHTGV